MHRSQLTATITRDCCESIHRIRWICNLSSIFCILVWIAISCSEIHSHEEREIPRMLYKKRPKQQEKQEHLHDGRRGEESEQENLYIGYSGNPWSLSTFVGRRKNPRLSPSSSAHSSTINNTISKQTPQILFDSIRYLENISTEVRGHSKHVRFKRGVIHLYNMVICATGCNPLAYKGYGCYCGFLGSGYTTDGIDQCCKMHDWCYDTADCPMLLEYFVPYYWKCHRGYKPVCAVEHGEWGGAGSCAQRLCECDRSLAECLRQYSCPTSKAMCTSSPWRLVQNLFMIY